MIVIAQNLNMRNKHYMDALKKKDTNTITKLAKDLAKAGADIINIQCSDDGNGDADAMPLVVKVIVEATGLTVSLDSRNIEALKKSIPLCDIVKIVEVPIVTSILPASLRSPSATEDNRLYKEEEIFSRGSNILSPTCTCR